MPDFFPVAFSVLESKALLQALNEKYPMKIDVCHLWQAGVNSVYLLKTAQGLMYLRIGNAGWRTKKDYEEEIYIINSLHDHGIPAVTPVADRSGGFLWALQAPEGLRYAVVFREAKKTPGGDPLKKTYNMGKLAAQLHNTADEENFSLSRIPIDFFQMVSHPFESLAVFEERRADLAPLKTAAEALWAYIEDKLPRKKPYYGYCHGDMHPGNIFFDGEQPQIFDFDCMGYGYRAYDICIFLWNMSINDVNYVDSDEWRKYLEGYNSVRCLDTNELSCIPAFAALRHIWLMGFHVGGTAYNLSWSNFNDKYFSLHINQFKLWYHRVFPE